MEQYNQVPNIISSKDLAYLSDMFEWNYGAYKNSCNSSNEVTDERIKAIIDRSAVLFNNNMSKILNILGGSYEQ